MCGIAGAIALGDRLPDVERVRRMSDLIAHRGPDGHGLWIAPSGRACLAHRRLSVIDLATGAQPLVRGEGTVGLTYNGEIYNYIELRAQLLREGSTFQTTSDTEVLLEGYLRHGEAALRQLRGMYAFAIWDDRTQTLILARDPVGKKPLTYMVDDDCLYFASTLPALTRTARRPLSIDLRAIDSFLSLGYIPAPSTAYHGVHKLPAASIGVVTGSRPELEVRRIVPPPQAAPPAYSSFAQAKDAVRATIEEAVTIRLRSDVPLGVFLSGGIDSSLVTAIAARCSSTPIQTFSMGFEGGPLDETERAQAVAEALGTEHRTFHSRSNLLQFMPEVLRHTGEPFADATVLPLWMLAQRTREHVSVALGGDGGDEGFAGYNWYPTAIRMNQISHRVPGWMSASAARFRSSDGMVGRLGRMADMLSLDDARRYAWLREMFHDGDKAWLYSARSALAGDHRARINASLEGAAQVYREAGGDSLQRMRRVDMDTYLADCLMPKLDIATMAHALEARAPLLDWELLRQAHNLSPEWVRNDTQGKLMLRALLSDLLPAHLIKAPKQGFDVPLAAWYAGDERAQVDGLATHAALMDTGWFSAGGIRRLATEHLDGTRNHGERIFAVSTLAQWLAQQ